MSEKEKEQARQCGSSAAGVGKLGPKASFNGQLDSQEDMIIEGRFKGRIALPASTLTIAPGAVVEAEIEAGNVILEGELTGNITASDRVQVLETAAMTGDISAERVSVSSGARFLGSLKVGKV